MTTARDTITHLVDEIAKVIEAAALSAPDEAVDGTVTTVPLAVVRGFPREETLQLPTLSVRAGRATTRAVWFDELSTETSPVDPALVRVRWREAWVELPVTLDLYTRSRTQRYVLRPLLEDIFGGDLADPTARPPGLELTLTDIDDSPARVRWLTAADNDDGTANSAIFRLNVVCQAHISKERVADFEASSYTSDLLVEVQ